MTIELKQYQDELLCKPNLEGSIIGSMIQSVSCRNLIFSIVKDYDFMNPLYQEMFKCIQELSSKNEDINHFTVERYTKIPEEYKAEFHFSNHINQLMNASMSIHELPKNIAILQEFTTRRMCKAIGSDLKDFASDLDKDITELSHIAQDNINKVMVKNHKTTAIHVAVIKETIKARFVLNNDNLINNIPAVKDPDLVGINEPALDEYTGGGLMRGWLITVAGRPGMGKSSIVLSMAYNMSKTLPVLFISLEMSERELVEKIICAECEIYHGVLKAGSCTKYKADQINKTMDNLNNSNLYIDDCDSATIADIDNKIRDFIAEHGVLNSVTGKKEIGAVFIDHLGLVSVPYKDLTRDKISEITRSFKSFAKKYHVPIIQVSKVSRECEKRQDKRPILSDLADASSVEYDSNMVIFPFRPEYYKSDDKAKIVEMIFAKFRGGPTGKIDMFFDAGMSIFGSLEGRNY